MREAAGRHLVIYGRVQGVGFRASTQQTARSLHLNGWVRNRADGGVEVLVWGEPAAVERFVDWCRQGPPLARIDDMRVEEAAPGEESGFQIRY